MLNVLLKGAINQFSLSFPVDISDQSLVVAKGISLPLLSEVAVRNIPEQTVRIPVYRIHIK